MSEEMIKEFRQKQLWAIRKLFIQLDKNSNESVSYEEFAHWLELVVGLSEKESFEEADYIYGKYDYEDDGVLYFDEFEKAYLEIVEIYLKPE